MVVHNPLVLVLPRAARDRCSPMVCILYFNLENSIGQEEEVWDLGVGFFPCPWHLFVFVAVCCLGGGDGDMRMAGPAKGALAWATQNLCLGAGHCLQTGLSPEGPQGGGMRKGSPCSGRTTVPTQTLLETALPSFTNTEKPDFFA